MHRIGRGPRESKVRRKGEEKILSEGRWVYKVLGHDVVSRDIFELLDGLPRNEDDWTLGYDAGHCVAGCSGRVGER